MDQKSCSLQDRPGWGCGTACWPSAVWQGAAGANSIGCVERARPPRAGPEVDTCGRHAENVSQLNFESARGGQGSNHVNDRVLTNASNSLDGDWVSHQSGTSAATAPSLSGVIWNELPEMNDSGNKAFKQRIPHLHQRLVWSLLGSYRC